MSLYINHLKHFLTNRNFWLFFTYKCVEIGFQWIFLENFVSRRHFLEKLSYFYNLKQIRQKCR